MNTKLCFPPPSKHTARDLKSEGSYCLIVLLLRSLISASCLRHEKGGEINIKLCKHGSDESQEGEMRFSGQLNWLKIKVEELKKKVECVFILNFCQI